MLLTPMVVETCAFETDRLIVRPWHSAPDDEWPRIDLVTVVAEVMTEPVTRHLPDSWQGRFSPSRAAAWVTERDDEGSTLLIVERQSREASGLVVLFESQAVPHGLLDIRLGYLLAEAAWGKGLATELLSGFVGWCRDQPSIESITGGIAPANEPSRRVLERVGFSSVEAGNRHPDDELLYRLELPDR